MESNNKRKSVVDKIKGFKELLDMGAITQEEFDVKKKQLLDLDVTLEVEGNERSLEDDSSTIKEIHVVVKETDCKKYGCLGAVFGAMAVIFFLFYISML